MAGDVPACPRACTGSRVVRDGIQRSGGREKQRWRCTPSDGAYHRFLGSVSRTRATDETCAECENHVAPHQGPAAPAEFEYLVREIAGALVDVGRGNTYTDVAKRVRTRANVGKTARYREVESGQTVAEWMADFVPVVTARHEPDEWPTVLVLDSISFRWTDPGDSKNHTLHSILAAFGYDENGRHGRLWKLEAAPAANTGAWEEFFSALPGTPLSIVCDRGKDIHGGIRAHWGDDTFDSIVHLCEYHLSANAKDALRRDKFTPNDDIWKLYNKALTTRDGWDAFEAAVDKLPTAPFLKKWTAKLVGPLRAQTARRAEIPSHLRQRGARISACPDPGDDRTARVFLSEPGSYQPDACFVPAGPASRG